ncbi:phosphoribosylglycinamide formyltransferase [Zavarzinia aquatilis]|uniref:Phosphoribosylglycinamide formyltransferase n=1 Tax=Zavarzinia aquatilis TaxID=2211142 RepID=A0A317E2Q9_9PROT|nr:phosphoribosylglycinamide formyltransferase [Zavarzinia aquatilis]
MSGKRRAAILISGRGSNMAALLDVAAAQPGYPADIALVLSNRPGAAGLARAEAAGIPTQVIDHKAYAGRAEFDTALDAALEAAGIDLVVLAGFMRLLTPGFTEKWLGRMVNIHPSLLPSFKGVHVHEQALAAGVRFSGCTVHFVTADMDAGPIIGQAVVPVHPGDTADTLAARTLAAEHRLYPAAVALVATGGARLEAGRTVYDGDGWDTVTLT